jgi:hypothetical protein
MFPRPFVHLVVRCLTIRYGLAATARLVVFAGERDDVDLPALLAFVVLGF